MNDQHDEHAGTPAEQDVSVDGAEPIDQSAAVPADQVYPEPVYPQVQSAGAMHPPEPDEALIQPVQPPVDAMPSPVVPSEPEIETPAEPPAYEYETGMHEQVVPDQVAPEQVAPEQVAPEQVAPEQVAPAQVSAEQAPAQVSAEQAPAQHGDPNQVASLDPSRYAEQPAAGSPYAADVPQPGGYAGQPSTQPSIAAPAFQPPTPPAQTPSPPAQPPAPQPATGMSPTAGQAAAEQPTQFAQSSMMGNDREPIDLVADAVTAAFNAGSSDVHLHAGLVPYARLSGVLQPIPGQQAIDEDALMEALRSMTMHAPDKLREYRDDGEADLSWAIPQIARFRVNIYRERGNTSVVLRVIPNHVPQLAEIGVPDVVRQLADAQRGLILVTGATGSGKSTTLGAMIDHINRTASKHILTIEDPIEILHSNDQSVISQREVGIDTPGFKPALRRALRQDPDVILVGEIRDEETMQTALSAAETGHLVLSTLHTNSASESIGRILDLFPASHERQARAMLSSSLIGIISQRLVRSTQGGRVPAVEIMVQTGRTMRCIANPAETGNLEDVIKDGGFYGMQSFDQALLALLMEQRVSVDEAIRNANQPQNFRLMMEAAGLGPDGQMTPEALTARASELQERQTLLDAEDQADALSSELANIHAQMEAQGMRVPGASPQAPGGGGMVPPPGAPPGPPGVDGDGGMAPPAAA